MPKKKPPASAKSDGPKPAGKTKDWTAILNGTALVNRRLVINATILVCGGKIMAAGAAKAIRVPPGARRIDATGRFVAPGFIDIHIHGSGGCRAEDDATGMARHVIQNGTTWFLPTLISNDFGKMLAAIDDIRGRLGPVRGGATIGGIHLEGPFLNPKYGAQRPETNIEPEPGLVRQLIGRSGESLRLVTIAPERRGALEAIAAFRAAGAVVSIGHSDATEPEYVAGRAAGITHATHLFNAMPPQRWPTRETYRGTKAVGIEELILADDGVSADLVCDAVAAHVHPSLVKLAYKCKKVGQLSLITDAIVSAGLPCGEFKMADGQSVFTTAGEDVARLANGGLCGSAMSLCGAVRNIIKHAGVSLEQALTMVSEAPARAVGIFQHKGSIAAGKDADLVLLDSNFDVQGAMIRGRMEYEKA
ncbi:MAG: N-acetylglucosamine-6-phosphate deacetylase [Opitutaceae bacterium]|nr:N-acetylglucosamine-6-phosphate deacetylase [Opitutaceae bacterium]